MELEASRDYMRGGKDKDEVRETRVKQLQER